MTVSSDLSLAVIGYLCKEQDKQPNALSSLQMLAAREVVRMNQQESPDYGGANLADRIKSIFIGPVLEHVPRVFAQQGEITKVLSLKPDEIARKASILANLPLALEYALLIDDNNAKSRAIEAIAKAYIAAGNLQEAERAADLIPDWRKSDAFLDIASAHIDAGNINEFQRLITEAERASILIPVNLIKSDALRNIAEAYREAGNLLETERVANLIPNDWKKSEILLDIARAHREAGNINEFQRLLTEAKRIANLMPGNLIKSQVLLNIARAHREAGNLLEAERAANLIPNNDFIYTALLDIAIAHREADNINEFQRLLTEAERVRLI